MIYRQQRNNYRPRRRASSVPDITLPDLGKDADWKTVRTILCLDQSLTDSGAALFVDGEYVPVQHASGLFVGWALTVPTSWSRQKKAVAYGAWLRELISQAKPEIIIGESHPFARGKAETSTASLEALIGIRWISMFIAGQNKIPYVEFSTNHVKYILCGSVSASKNSVQTMLRATNIDLPIYELKPAIINGNVCDAIAMGVVISRMQTQERLLAEYAPIVGNGRSQTKTRSR